MSLLELMVTLAAAPHPCPETFTSFVSFFSPHYRARLGKQISPLLSFGTTMWFSQTEIFLHLCSNSSACLIKYTNVHMGIHCLTHVCTLLIRMHSLHVRTHAHAHTHSQTYSHLPSVSFSEGNKLGFQTMLGARFSRGVI